MKNFSGLTITGATSDGYSVKANGYVKGSWLQSSVMQNYGSNTGKVCVFDNSGWIYYRTPAEIVAEAGGSGGSTEVVQTTGTSTTSVMSQKATTDELAKKANLNGGNDFTGGGQDFILPNGNTFYVSDENDTTLVSINKEGFEIDDEGTGTIPMLLHNDAGTSGQVLTSQGAGKTPQWTTPTKGTVTSVSVKMNGASKGTVTSSGAIDLGTVLTDDGGTINKSKTIKMDASANSDGANLKWGTVNRKNPYIGYASDQVDGTFVVGSLLGTNYASGLAIGGGSGNLLWKGTKVATTSDIPNVSGKANLSGGNTFSGAQRFKDSIEFVDSNGDGVLSLGNNAIFVDPEDRGLIPVSFSGSFGLSGQVLTSQGHNTTPRWEYVTKHGYTELTNEDLDTITEVGWYRAASGNTCTNRPSRILSTDPFVLEVEKSTDVYTKQTLYMTGNSGVYTTAIYFRMKGSSWSTWQESALVYKGVDQTFSGRKTFSSGINLQGSLQANGSAGTAGQVLTSTGSGTPEWKDISGSADAMPTIRLVSIKDTTGTGICGPNNPLRFSFVVESGTLLDTDYVELCSRTLFTYPKGHYLNHFDGVQDFGRTYKLRAFYRVAVSNLTNDEGFYKFEIGGTGSNYALRDFVRSNMPTPISKSPYSITKYIRIMRNSNSIVPKNIHSNVIPIYVAPTKPIEDASTNMWSAKIRIR